MKLFNKKSERLSWFALILAIPFTLFLLKMKSGTIGFTEIIITIVSLAIGIIIVYLTKWYANKN